MFKIELNQIIINYYYIKSYNLFLLAIAFFFYLNMYTINKI